MSKVIKIKQSDIENIVSNLANEQVEQPNNPDEFILVKDSENNTYMLNPTNGQVFAILDDTDLPS
jgi:hypothetical protein